MASALQTPSSTIRHYPHAATIREPDQVKAVRVKTGQSDRKLRGKQKSHESYVGSEHFLKADHEDHRDNPAMMDFNDMYRCV